MSNAGVSKWQILYLSISSPNPGAWIANFDLSNESYMGNHQTSSSDATLIADWRIPAVPSRKLTSFSHSKIFHTIMIITKIAHKIRTALIQASNMTHSSAISSTRELQIPQCPWRSRGNNSKLGVYQLGPICRQQPTEAETAACSNRHDKHDLAWSDAKWEAQLTSVLVFSTPESVAEMKRCGRYVHEKKVACY